jgi:hypothetical protein
MWKFYSQEKFAFWTKFGLHETPWLAGMNKIWRRYVAQTFSQELGWNNLGDYGLTFVGVLGEKGKIGKAYLSMFNGNGEFDSYDPNPKKDLSFVVWLNPLHSNEDYAASKLGFQYYKGYHEDYDYQWEIDPQGDRVEVDEDLYKNNVMSFVGNFDFKKLFAIGAEYNTHTTAWDPDSDLKETLITVFGELDLGEAAPDNEFLKTLSIFFRYGMFDPDADDHVIGQDANGDDVLWEETATSMLFGVECSPVKGVSTSINYRTQTDKDIYDFGNDELYDETESYIYLNAGFWF